MSEKQTLTIILTNYNHARFLPRALDAIVNQSRTPDEVIVVDDKSTDYSLAVIQHYADRYPFVRLHANEKNLGVTGATNAGTALAKGTFVQRIAADDYLLPGAVETLMGLADRWPTAGIASAPMLFTIESHDTDWSETPSAPTIFDKIEMGWSEGFHTPAEYTELLETGPMTAMSSLSPSTIYKTSLVREFGNWPAELGMHEVSFILRACGLHSGVAYSHTPVYMWIMRPGGLTADEEGKREKYRANMAAQAERMRDPRFASLFSDGFRARWDRDSAEALNPRVELPPAPKPSLWSKIRRSVGV